MINKKRKPTKEERAAYAIVGHYGGLATKKSKGIKHYSNIGKLGAESRWGKKSTDEKVNKE